MDGTTFDHLTERLATTRLTRVQTLRGLVAGGIATFTGGRLTAEVGEAKKKREKRIRICHRSSATDPGSTRKLKKTKAKRHLKRHEFDTRGRCSAAPGVPCTSNAQCPGGQVCLGGTCGDCTSYTQCSATGQVCLGGRCLGFEACDEANVGERCPQSPYLRCELWDDTGATNEFRCLLDTACTDDEGALVPGNCDANELCLVGDCVEFCSTGGDCPADHDCVAGVCLATPMTVSDRALKANLATVDPLDMLGRVRQLPITTWNYTGDDPAIRHIGPMAQDFAAAFGVGADDRSIHPIDGQGVALAAIQGLAAELERLRAENAALAARLAVLDGGG